MDGFNAAGGDAHATDPESEPLARNQDLFLLRRDRIHDHVVAAQH